MARKKVRMMLNGSSLVEAVIAMVVIVIVFGIALVVITNVTRSSLSVTKATAQKVLDKAIADAERTGGPAPDQTRYSIEGLTIDQQIIPYWKNPALNVIRLSALNEKGDTILTMRKVLLDE
ncbi:hypothetical protein [Mucilaginibacter psychrotolerans]|uniref:Type II secretion system protein n=1 Tax=Mucilaginibacter psychrotolerans TaxID=1524096 RepID=A0A4Y8SC69_9SPHI|nr:hypothetical protein [Mucilaginibacter psychrotolerans]TFF36215.1 hypothetical protein E2R66_16885 [Mucilaginibacter psychrotolerans]